MVIEEIVLHNFGVFRGRQRAVLAPPSKRQPVVLIGGLNGAGKTTLLEAMQLVLYGRSGVNGQRNGLGYDEYIRKVINRQVNPREGAGVEVVLRVNEDGESIRIRVRRTWNAAGAKVTEKVEVFRNDVLDQHLADTWLDYVCRLIPPQLSELFFFDGERIESLADPAQSLEILRTAVHALLGVDLVKQLQADLVVLNRRKMIEQRRGPDRAKLETAEETVRRLEIALEELNLARGMPQGRLDRKKNKLAELNEKFAREGGLLAEDRAATEKTHAELERDKAQVELELRSLAAGCLPLAMIDSMLSDVRKQATDEADAHQAAMAKCFAERRDKRLLDRLRDEATDAQLVERVAALLTEDREKYLKVGKCEIYLHLDDESRRQLDALCSHGLTAAVESAQVLVKKSRQVQRMLDDADRKLASIPDADAISRLLKERDELKAECNELESQLKRANEDFEAAKREHALQKAVLDKLTEEARLANVENEESSRFVRHAERARETLERFRIALTEKHADRLSANIFAAFGQLLRKQRLVHRLSIDPATCKLTLLDSEGNELPSERLSAGERQLLAVSILWGLGQAAGRPLPVIVDTPLGRLDTKHRMHLVQRYFPSASHQVILLSTDEEITKEYLEALRPRIGHCYRLVHDDDARCTTIEPGYFEEEVVPC